MEDPQQPEQPEEPGPEPEPEPEAQPEAEPEAEQEQEHEHEAEQEHEPDHDHEHEHEHEHEAEQEHEREAEQEHEPARAGPPAVLQGRLVLPTNGTRLPDGIPLELLEMANAPRQPRPRRGVIRRFPVTFGLTVVTVAFFVMESLLGGTTSMSAQFRLGALRGDLVFQDGELYRLMCAVFLHHGLIHFGINWFAFLQLGALVEYLYGSWRLLTFYLISGLVSSLASAIFLDDAILGGSRGASGAIMGLAGVLLWAGYYAKFDPFVSLRIERERLARRLLWCVILTFALGIGIGFFIPIIDNWGHGGGFVAGFLLAAGFKGPVRTPSRRVHITAGILFSLTVGCFVWMSLDGQHAAEMWHEDEAIEAEIERLTEQVSDYRSPSMFDKGDADARVQEGQAQFRSDVQAVDDPRILGPLSLRLSNAKWEPETAVVLERWLEVEPDDPHALNGMAWHLVTRTDEENRDPRRAEKLSRKSLELIEDPKSLNGRFTRSAYLDTLAEILFQLERYDEALVHQREAVRLAEEITEPRSSSDRVRRWVFNLFPGQSTLDEMRARLEKIEAAANPDKDQAAPSD